MQTLVTDDGRHVVTLDNWYGAGYGDDVLAFYSADGQSAKYSLEQIVAQSADGLREMRHESGYFKLQHSTSSRHWLRNSVQLLETEGSNSTFCVWLEWLRRWYAWDVATGKQIATSGELITLWNRKTRRQVLDQIKSGDIIPEQPPFGPGGAYEFLGQLRRSEDRPLIEALLKDSEFSTATQYAPSSEGDSITFIAYSFNREAADRILSEWDGKHQPDRFSDENYNFLGRVDGVVKVVSPPTEKDGSLRIYMLPPAITSANLQEAGVEHYLRADFSYLRPSSTSALTNELRFSIRGVTPGQYRVIAVWDKEAPLTPDTVKIARASVGDYVTVTTPLVTIKARATATVALDCTAPYRESGK